MQGPGQSFGAAGLSALARRQAPAAAPYGYDEFVRRHRRRLHRRRAAGWVAAASLTAVVAVVGIGLYGAVQGPQGVPPALADATDGVPPALVQADRELLHDELEAHIAWLDAVLSADAADVLSGPERMQLRRARVQLAGSLQRVAYARALLGD